jgi:hypothetical protein
MSSSDRFAVNRCTGFVQIGCIEKEGSEDYLWYKTAGMLQGM